MKLLRFGPKGNEKPGVLYKGERKDCSGAFEDWNHDFFNNQGLKKLEALLQDNPEIFPNVSSEERWASPISRPGMILCVGLNYSDHAKESGMPIPEEPILFMKATNTLSGPNDDVSIPKNSTKTDWEVELGIVIKKDALYLKDTKEAQAYIAGYSLVHDVSERSFQLERGGQWVKGKSCPGFSPVGPYLVTPEELPNVNSLQMKLSVNDSVMQTGSTATMIFDPAYIVWYVSQFMLLEAGDLISTGTPPGVGLGFDPPKYLKHGDVVALEIDGLGKQRQTFLAYE